jgi:hypothetical protein
MPRVPPRAGGAAAMADSNEACPDGPALRCDVVNTGTTNGMADPEPHASVLESVCPSIAPSPSASLAGPTY